MAKKKDLKKFRGGIRLESTSEPTDLAGSTADAGIMYYDSTSESIKVHNGSGFSAVGGGSGGRDDRLLHDAHDVSDLPWRGAALAGGGSTRS